VGISWDFMILWDRDTDMIVGYYGGKNWDLGFLGNVMNKCEMIVSKLY
jgi:hypothetical protein